MGTVRVHKRAFVRQDDGSYRRQDDRVVIRRERDRPTWEVVRPGSGAVVARGEADFKAARQIGRAL